MFPLIDGVTLVNDEQLTDLRDRLNTFLDLQSDCFKLVFHRTYAGANQRENRSMFLEVTNDTQALAPLLSDIFSKKRVALAVSGSMAKYVRYLLHRFIAY